MNIEERDRVLSIIKEIQRYNIAEEIGQYYDGSPDLNTMAIGRYPVNDFIHFFNKAITSLKSELESENYFFYPLQGHAQPIASIQIESLLNQMLNYLAIKNSPAIAGPLDPLITYEYYFGIWQLSSHKIHKPAEIQLTKKKFEIDFLSKKLDLSIEKLSISLSEVESAKNQVVTFLNQKQQELAQVATNLSKSNTESQQITQILTNARASETELNNIVTVQNEKLEQIKKEFENEQKSYAEFDVEVEAITKKLGETLKMAEDKLVLSKEALLFIESKRNDIIKLTGFAADGTLGYKFDDRQSKILKGISLWKWGVPVVTIISIIWVVVVFTCLSAHFDNYWLTLIVNVFKTFPVFILMGFVFKQYNKERNLQEEYAFKAAVAMTITSYSDMLKDQDTDKNTTRQELLANVIKEVYTSPKLQADVKQKLLTFNTKDLKEAIMQLTGILNEAKHIVK